MIPVRPIHLRAAFPAVLLVTATLLFAGCFGTNAKPASGADQAAVPLAGANNTTESVEVFPFEGTVTGFNTVILYANAPLGADSFPFTVDAGATAIVTELVWDNPIFDLDPLLAAPSCDVQMGQGNCNFDTEGSHLMGDTPLKYTIWPDSVNETGEWTLIIFAKDAANTSFKGAVSVFYGKEPKPDYAAAATQD